METRLGGKLHHFYGPVVSDLGKESLEWDLNDWRWDGDLFLAAPLNSVPSNCKNKQLFPVGSNNGATASNCFPPGLEELIPGAECGNGDSEKKKRVYDLENEEVGGNLNLKLGGQVYYAMEGQLLDDNSHIQENICKRTKVTIPQSSRTVCQVEDCNADLSSAKDYHRRHKVCEVHSKTTCALVGNVMQRFCQQCSRFHVLNEFDEGKRSCRRRLAGHNKRRRKTHPENVVNAATGNDEQGSNYLLISLLKILSNIHSNSPDRLKDQDLLSHLLSNLANLASATNGRNNAGFPVSQNLQNTVNPLGPAPEDLSMPTGPVVPGAASVSKQKVLKDASILQSASLFPTIASNSTKERTPDTTIGRTGMNNIDLNDEYDGSQECTEELANGHTPKNLVNMPYTGSLLLLNDSQQSSPPQISRNSGSTFSQSHSTSSGETQSRTDRIVFKLFGKDPSDFPLVLRKQILDWLSNSPSDIESYIRPGCIILTVYLRMDKSSWDELCCELASSLSRLLDSSTDPFWKMGWIYTRVQHRVTFMYNGQLVLDTPLLVKHHRNCRISSIKPIAVTMSDTVRFSVKGFYPSHSTLRFSCTLEGNYLVHENFVDTTRGADSFEEHDRMQSFTFSCVIPDIVGRGFVEVEDHALNSCFFPFIVAEKNVCSEICSLESLFEVDETEESEVKNRALEFIHEMGWILHRNRLRHRLLEQTIGHGDLKPFSFQRFRWLAEFSIDHDWCAVVRKLLNILFDGTLDLGGEGSNNLERLLEMGLLHRAVRRKCRPMVDFLLSYSLSRVSDKMGHQYLFRPDVTGPGGLTPLHVAACLDSCDSIVDALTQDPGQVGVKAWKSAKDSIGLTPHDYARMQSHHSYNNLVDKKSENGHAHVIVNMFDMDSKTEKASKLCAAFECESKAMTTSWQSKEWCRACRAKRLLMLGHEKCSIRLYRPVMVSMVAIAAVCVCTALLFKSSPEVLCMMIPFEWELLKFGFE